MIIQYVNILFETEGLKSFFKPAYYHFVQYHLTERNSLGCCFIAAKPLNCMPIQLHFFFS